MRRPCVARSPEGQAAAERAERAACSGATARAGEGSGAQNGLLRRASPARQVQALSGEGAARWQESEPGPL
jgi:hypothetical protein